MMILLPAVVMIALHWIETLRACGMPAVLDDARAGALLAPVPDPAGQLDRNGDPIPPWSRRRRQRGTPPAPPVQATIPYAELHSHSNFSFLDGASDPEDLI